MTSDVLQELTRLVALDDIPAAAQLLRSHPEDLKSVQSKSDCSFGRILSELRSLGMADLLLQNGFTLTM